MAERIALWATPLLFKANATTNLQAELLAGQGSLMDGDAQQFASNAQPVIEAMDERAASLGAHGWHSLYNPLGKTLASGPPDLSGAAARVHDDEGLLRAVRLKATLLAKPVAFADAAAFVAASAPALGDPYSGHAFSWRAADAGISLTQMGSHPVALLAVPLASKK